MGWWLFSYLNSEKWRVSFQGATLVRSIATRSNFMRSICHKINSIFMLIKRLFEHLTKRFGSCCDLVEFKLISIKPACLHTSNLKENKL